LLGLRPLLRLDLDDVTDMAAGELGGLAACNTHRVTMTLSVGRQEGHPACKTEWRGAGVVTCLERGADLHTAQLEKLPR